LANGEDEAGLAIVLEAALLDFKAVRSGRQVGENEVPGAV